MELTRENMLDWIVRYFDAVRTAGPQDKSKMEEFFTPDYIIRYGRPLKIWNRDQWVELLCNPSEKFDITHNTPPYFWLFDVEKKAAAGTLKEQIKDPATGQIIRQFVLTAYFGFTVVDGAVKCNWELIAWLDVPYLVDSLDGNNPAKPWYEKIPR